MLGERIDIRSGAVADDISVRVILLDHHHDVSGSGCAGLRLCWDDEANPAAGAHTQPRGCQCQYTFVLLHRILLCRCAFTIALPITIAILAFCLTCLPSCPALARLRVVLPPRSRLHWLPRS